MPSGRVGESGQRPGESERQPGESGRWTGESVWRPGESGLRRRLPASGRAPLVKADQAELSRTIGLPELEKMGATAAPPPSREELGIEENEEVGCDLRWGWTLE
jgi:hypothetical protein